MSDRVHLGGCDRCNTTTVQAFAQWEHDIDVLAFCLHHHREIGAALKALGWRVAYFNMGAYPTNDEVMA